MSMTFSAAPSYALGLVCLAMGVNNFLRPFQEYGRFGLPLEPPPPSIYRPPNNASPSRLERTKVPEGAPSPLIYIKGIRESTYGLAFIALQYKKQDAAVTILAAIVSLAGLGDGLVVWMYGGEKLRKKAFGHWATFIGFVGWAMWRASFA